MKLEAGHTVAGRYRLVEPLGHGGMGSVWHAVQTETGEHVALKAMLKRSDADKVSMERFRREARAARAINSPFIARLLDMEEDVGMGVVLVFELLEGQSLVQRLKQSGPLPFDELWGIIESIWLGLVDAHQAGIVHRDLKPSNIFLRTQEQAVEVKILDFGISKLPKLLTEESLTREGQSLGTFAFMPPEQMDQAREVDERADIYACSTLIFQALSGHLPYTSKNLVRLMQLKRATAARPLADVIPAAVPEALEAFLAKGLERDPADRYQSAEEALVAWRSLKPEGAVATSSTDARQEHSREPRPPDSVPKDLVDDLDPAEPPTLVLQRKPKTPEAPDTDHRIQDEPPTVVAQRNPATNRATNTIREQSEEAAAAAAKGSEPLDSIGPTTTVWQRPVESPSEPRHATPATKSPATRGLAWKYLLLFVALGYLGMRVAIHFFNG